MNTKGSILVDVFGALAPCFLLVFLLVPMLVNLKQERQNVLYKIMANHLLYEQLQKEDLQSIATKQILHEGKIYTFSISNHETNPSWQKGCIQYTDAKNRVQEICDIK
ncbi:hypothetical protein [Peribacillus tepidiphilus]|uniref:hypothetical protein n=1 Tax=Peribacillus tepidiphilus TaxID=2652445 RepID=UPI0035B56B3E